MNMQVTVWAIFVSFNQKATEKHNSSFLLMKVMCYTLCDTPNKILLGNICQSFWRFFKMFLHFKKKMYI